MTRSEPQPGTPRAHRQDPHADAPADEYSTYLVPVDGRIHADVPVVTTSPEAAQEFVRDRANYTLLPGEPVGDVVVGDPAALDPQDSLEAQNAQLLAALRRYEAGEIGSTVAHETLDRLGLADGAP